MQRIYGEIFKLFYKKNFTNFVVEIFIPFSAKNL